MPLTNYDHRTSEWAVEAEAWLKRALADVIDGRDAMPAATAALACLRIEAGEQPEDSDLLEVGPDE